MFQQIEVFTRLLLSIQWVRTLMREMNGLDDLHLSFEMRVMIPFHVLFFARVEALCVQVMHKSP